MPHPPYSSFSIERICAPLCQQVRYCTLSILDSTLSKSRTTCQFRTDSEHQLTFLSQIKQKNPETIRVMFIGTQVDTMSCKGADSVCCPLSCAFSLFLLCGKLEYLAQGRRNVRLRLALFHRAVHRADVAVHDADALVGAAGVFLRPLAYLDPLDEQPQ